MLTIQCVEISFMATLVLHELAKSYVFNDLKNILVIELVFLICFQTDGNGGRLVSKVP